MASESWVIDAGMSHEADRGLFCFCPMERDGSVVIGLSVISGAPPGNLVGIYHEDGDDAANAWIKAHDSQLAALSERINKASRG